LFDVSVLVLALVDESSLESVGEIQVQLVSRRERFFSDNSDEVSERSPLSIRIIQLVGDLSVVFPGATIAYPFPHET
jgi:hypothetical protein